MDKKKTNKNRDCKHKYTHCIQAVHYIYYLPFYCPSTYKHAHMNIKPMDNLIVQVDN